jgi:hypothetical protein
MILTTALAEVRERIGELSADFFTDAEVLRAVNEAIRHFNAEERWPWLLTEGEDALGDGEDTLDLPDGVDFGRFVNVSISADDLIQPILLERVTPEAGFRLRHAHSSVVTGPPRWYYVTSASIEVGGENRYVLKFVPPADRDYDLEYQYWRVPEDSDVGADTIDVPHTYADAVPAWAAGKLFLKEHAVSQKASEQFALYGAVVEQARNESFEHTTDEKVVWGREHPGERYFYNEGDYITYRTGNNPLGT